MRLYLAAKDSRRCSRLERTKRAVARFVRASARGSSLKGPRELLLSLPLLDPRHLRPGHHQLPHLLLDQAQRLVGVAHDVERLLRAGHPIETLTRKKFLEASHALVSYRGGHRVIEEALERAGLSRRIVLRVPHFTVVPMVLERTDLILTLPARVARVYERSGAFKSLPPPVPIPSAEVAVHWHERFDADSGNRWLREQLIALFAA